VRQATAISNSPSAESCRKFVTNEKSLRSNWGFEAGYHRTYISLIERGLKNPSLKTVFRLAETLNLPASELVRRLEGKLKD